MASDELRILAGELVEEELHLTLEELGLACAARRENLLELIEQGLLDSPAPEGGRYSGNALRRARAALRLQRDLGVNAAGAVLVVELLERIDVLQQRGGG